MVEIPAGGASPMRTTSETETAPLRKAELNGVSDAEVATTAAAPAGAAAPAEGKYQKVKLSPSTLAMRRGNDTFEDISRDLPEISMFCLTKENPLRRVIIRCIKHRYFTRAVLFVILLNCASLAASSQRPAFNLTPEGRFLLKVEYFFIAFFTLEMVLKIMGMGFILRKGTYMRDPWNVMDFVVVVLGLVSILPQADNYTAIRAVRVLRPLRTITRVKGMRNLVITLLESLPMLLDVLVLCFFAFFIYGIIGIQLMQGILRYRCAPLSMTQQELYSATERGDYETFCSGTRIDEGVLESTGVVNPTTTGLGLQCSGEDFCRLTNSNPNYRITNFDHFPAALLTIFQCISLEGWTDVMYAAQDALTGWIWIYFVSLIWFGSFFAVNLTLAVLYLRFKQSQEVSAEEAVIQQAEARAKGELDAQAAEDAANLVPVVSGPSWWRGLRRSCFRLQAHSKFEVLTMIIIIINTAIMMVERHPQPEAEQAIMDNINYLLTAYFGLEMLIKLAGLGVRKYVADTMNVFDGLVVIVSIVEISVTNSGGSGGSGLSVLRTFRLLRIFKLARSWKELNKIINTIFKSLASIAYLSLILLLIIFIFGLLGMQLFGYQYYYCDAYPRSFRLCPEDNTDTPMFELCPSHFRCYISCKQEEEGTWLLVPDRFDGGTSQFFDQALCEAKEFAWDGKHSLDLEHSPHYPPETVPDPVPVRTHYVALVGDSDLARHHFDDIYMSFITIFQILTGENWNSVMYDGMRSVGNYAVVYFVLLVVVGNYIILNLFLAILLDNFGGGNDDAETSARDPAAMEAALSASGRQVMPVGGLTPTMSANGMESAPADGGSTDVGEAGDDPTNIIKTGKSNRSLRTRNTTAMVGSTIVKNVEMTDRSLFLFGPENKLRVFLYHIVSHKYFEYIVILFIVLSSVCLALDSDDLSEKIASPEGTPGREAAVRLKDALRYLDWVFVIMFTVEAVLKIIVMGFVLHAGSYLRNPWNVLDFFIVIIGLVLLGTEGSNLTNLESLRALRTFRALRPIRMASRAEGMKVVVNALFQSIPPLGNVLLVCLLFFLIFSILFVNLLKGSFYYCQVVCPEQDVGADYCEGDSWLARHAGMRLDPVYVMGGTGVTTKDMNKEWCLANTDITISGSGFHYVGGNSGTAIPIDSGGNRHLVTSMYHWSEMSDEERTTFNITLLAQSLPPSTDGLPKLYHQWVNKAANFDNVWNSLITLFEMATLEMWLDIMYDAVDSTGVDQQPIRDSKLWICLVVVIFLVVCSFFVLNLFVGVTIDKFNDMKAKQEGRSLFLTNDQQNWLTIQKLLAATKPIRKFRPPQVGFRRSVFNIVTTDSFDAFIMAMIMCNVLFMSMEHYEMSPPWVAATTNANFFFTALFSVEAVMKLIAMGVIGYFRDAWNTFDFTVVTISLVGIFLEQVMSTNVSVVSLLRVFRVARIFRLIPKAKGLRTLFQTLLFSLPALFNVGSVLILFFFIFSIMGMNLFGSIRLGDNLNRHANFQNFPRSMLLLMRMATGESWNGIMHDCSVSDNCIRVLKPVQIYGWENVSPADSYVDSEDAWYKCVDCYGDGTSEYGPFVPDSGTKLPQALWSEYFEDECGHPMWLTGLYFCGFVLICSFILLNLVIAVILDNFQSSTANEAMPVSRFHMSRFVEVWADLDPDANYFIPVSKLSNLISELEPPLGVKGVVHTKSEVQNIIMTVDIPNRSGQVHFLETLHALSGRVAGTQLPEEEEEHIHMRMHERLPDSNYPKYSAAHYHAALYVQAAVRGFLARHQMKNRRYSMKSGDKDGYQAL
uniref:Voltage-gated ion channel superfamily n=1 Tax=Tetraselmis chuii TaxID=63592 RepID=A0A7S1XCD4_9CHLO|mmetsp:Transcript_9150/g.16497  ORF Transcript_9150/g.16497 Transcript_9150/m.16497 type:complete len:1791 (+) Transcript_9150:3-5375(+)